MSTCCVVVAAGRGARSGLAVNKVFFRWQGRSVLSRCLDALEASGKYDAIALVLAAEDMERWTALTEEEGAHPSVKYIVPGGATRQESVYAGLQALPEDTRLVSVHDAARPFVTADIIRATLADAATCGSGVISAPVTDTIKLVGDDGRISTLERARLRSVQTPQSFDYIRLMRAYDMAFEEGLQVTDDAALYEHCYGSVKLSESKDAAANIKLTNPADFARLNVPAVRIGTGYDAHRLKEGRRLVLCGVDIPHTRGLDGHSDADVATHALMDALLGAAALGDIGKLFPDRDPAYKGICSLILLEEVARRLRAAGYEIGNADVTIVAQAPKLAPFIMNMRERLAGAMGIGMDQVSVKATTTERMGFEGDETGISAQATALIVRMKG